MKVNFSLSKKKPKKKSKTSQKQETDIQKAFDSEDEQDRERKKAQEEALEQRTNSGPLIIPLIPHGQTTTSSNTNTDTNTNTDATINQDDEEAMEAVLQSAKDHIEHQTNQQSSSNNSTTNFSASGSLIISSQRTQPLLAHTNTNTNTTNQSDADKYAHDIQHRADDIAETSVSYIHVPISEFGAAMLRGMGWKGSDNPSSNNNTTNNNTTNDPISKQRHHRLGLGATPALTKKEILEITKAGTLSSKKKEREAILNRTISPNTNNHKKITSKELQTLLQNGSIVWVSPPSKPSNYTNISPSSPTPSSPPPSSSFIPAPAPKKRAKVLQTLGVPGLNQIRIQYELEQPSDTTTVSKHQLSLEPLEKLTLNPFQLPPAPVPTSTSTPPAMEPVGSNPKIKVEDQDIRIKEEPTRNTTNRPSQEQHTQKQYHHRTREQDRDNDRPSKDNHNHHHNNHHHHESSRKRASTRSRASNYDNDDRRRSPSRSVDSHDYDSYNKRRKHDRDYDRHDDRRDRRDRDRDRDRKDRDRHTNGDRSRDRDRRNDRDRDRDRHNDRDKDRDRHNDGDRRKDRDRHNDRDRNRGRNKDIDRDRDRSRDRDRGEKNERTNIKEKHRDKDTKHPSTSNNLKTSHFVPNIRVRIISSKVQKGQYKYQKGIILDILPHANITVKMDSSHHILEHVPSHCVETVVPRLSSNNNNNPIVCLLRRKYRGLKGRLLEKKRDDGVGMVQLYDDGSIVTERLDDMAEWCGPIDDDLDL